ncbi:MAG: ParB N-terminal domain-containing protein [Candidatus Bathyarchaeia archaeon]
MTQETPPPMLDIEQLKPHEQTDPLRLEELKKQLAADGYQKDPIIVDERHLIVIDGHHRILALRALGYTKVVAHKIKYLDDDRIIVKTWHPAIRGSRTELLKILQPYLEDAKPAENQQAALLVLNDTQHPLSASRETIMNSLLGRFSIEYAPDIETAKRLARSEGYAGAIVFNSIDKDQVVKAALSGRVLPPKTTQHIIPDKPVGWFIALDTLNNGVQEQQTAKRG